MHELGQCQSDEGVGSGRLPHPRAAAPRESVRGQGHRGDEPALEQQPRPGLPPEQTLVGTARRLQHQLRVGRFEHERERRWTEDREIDPEHLQRGKQRRKAREDPREQDEHLSGVAGEQVGDEPADALVDPLPSDTAATIDAKLSSVITIAAASRVTSVPACPSAIPMSASFRAGASLTPSPVIAIRWPRRFQARTIRSLCSAVTRA